MSAGREVIAAVSKGAAWGTAIESGALDGFLITGEGMGAGAPADLVAEEAGIGWQQTSEPGDIDIEGTLSGFLRYDSAVWRLIAAGLGTAGAPSTVDTSARLHTFTPADSLSGIYASVALDKGPEVWDYPSCKVIGFSISGEAGQPVTYEITLRCDSLSRNTSSGVNNNTTMANVTYRSKATRVLMQHLVFRMNVASGSALAGGDAISISSFNLTVARPHSTDHTAGTKAIIEPIEDGMPVVTLDIAIPEYTVGTRFAEIVSRTANKADLIFTSGTLAGAASQNYQIDIPIPQLVLTAGESNVSAGSKLTQTFAGRCEEAQSAPSGDMGTKPFRIFVYNKHTADEFA